MDMPHVVEQMRKLEDYNNEVEKDPPLDAQCLQQKGELIL